MANRSRALLSGIFSGCGRLCRAISSKGIQAFEIDNATNPEDDVLDPLTESAIVELLLSGAVFMVWLGMPCATFSVARRHDGLGPGPIRSDSYPMGLPWTRGRDRAKLITGNQLFFFTMRIVCICLCLKIPVVLENPMSSRCWITPILQQLLHWNMLQVNDLDFCQFGERWKKPTRLASNFIDLSSLRLTCKGTFLHCSYSGKRHIQLKGTENSGRYMTLIAQPYPYILCERIAAGSFGIFKFYFTERRRIGEESTVPI